MISNWLLAWNFIQWQCIHIHINYYFFVNKNQSSVKIKNQSWSQMDRNFERKNDRSADMCHLVHVLDTCHQTNSQIDINVSFVSLIICYSEVYKNRRRSGSAMFLSVSPTLLFLHYFPFTTPFHRYNDSILIPWLSWDTLIHSKLPLMFPFSSNFDLNSFSSICCNSIFFWTFQYLASGVKVNFWDSFWVSIKFETSLEGVVIWS